MMMRHLWLGSLDVDRYAIVCSDALVALHMLESNSVDLIATDPPYESLEKYRATGTTTRLTHSKRSSNDWFQIFPNSRFPALFRELYRVLKKDRHCYIWCDDETSDIIKPLATAAGFHVWKRLVWDKKVIGMGYHYRARYEFILFMEKGKRQLVDRGVPDVIECRRITKRGAYPAEKPIPLYELLINQSTAKGDLVVDPFCGSGNGGVAAMRNGRLFLGFDISKDATALSRANIRGAIGG